MTHIVRVEAIMRWNMRLHKWLPHFSKEYVSFFQFQIKMHLIEKNVYIYI